MVMLRGQVKKPRLNVFCNSLNKEIVTALLNDLISNYIKISEEKLDTVLPSIMEQNYQMALK